jgi:hypothetical protein
MKYLKILARPKSVSHEGHNRFSLPLSHRLGRLTVLPMPPDSPYSAKIAIDPDDRTMEFVVVATVDLRFADHHRFSQTSRQRPACLAIIDAMSSLAWVTDLQTT